MFGPFSPPPTNLKLKWGIFLRTSSGSDLIQLSCATLMMGLRRWVEEEGGRVVLCDRGEDGGRPPAQRQRARGSQTCFQVISSTIRVCHSAIHIQPDSCLLGPCPPQSVYFPVLADVDFLWLQLRWGFSEGECELQNREGAVAAASLLRVWRYAWLLEAIYNSTKCDSGGRDYNGPTGIIAWGWP